MANRSSGNTLGKRTSSAQTDLKSILYVDDEPDLRSVVRIALESVGGFRVLTCKSGEDAIELAPSFSPDLILLDVMMPGLDGFATHKGLQMVEGLEATPVIFITAKSQALDLKNSDTHNVAGIIRKPFDPMLLTEMVTEMWQAHHRRPAPHDGLMPMPDMSPLIGRYLVSLDQTLDFLVRLQMDVSKTGAMPHAQLLEDAIDLVHRTAGSAGSFGFAAISEHCLKLEERLLTAVSGGCKLVTLLHELDQTIASISLAIDSSPARSPRF